MMTRLLRSVRTVRIPTLAPAGTAALAGCSAPQLLPMRMDDIRDWAATTVPTIGAEG